MAYRLNDQDVEISEVDFNDGVAMVIEAYYVDSENALSEEETEELSRKYQSKLAKEAHENMVDYVQSHYGEG